MRFPVSRLRILASLLIAATLAVACTSSDDQSASSSESAEITTADSSSAETSSTDTASTEDTVSEEPVIQSSGDAQAGLIATNVDEPPFDLSGGATSSDDGVIIVTDDPRSDLAGAAESVTRDFETDWTRRTIDLTEMLPGLRAADPRDLIPPIDNPMFESVAGGAEWIAENEPGALVRIDGEIARFYPLSILTAHEIVNDRIGDVPVAVTYCPLCNTAIAYDRRVDGEVLRFGVSGLLRKSDLVMWDNATTSLWQQISGEGIVGTYAGTQLLPLSTAIVSFGQFAESFPDGLSLSRETGFSRSYGANPYTGYSSSQSPFLFDGEPDPRFPALSRVVGVIGADGQRAYPFEPLAEAQVVNDTFEGRPVVVLWADGTADALDRPSIADSRSIGTAVAFDATVDGRALTFVANGDGTFTDDQTGSTWSVTGRALSGELAGTELATLVHKNEFWFAFAGFFPDTEVWTL